MVETRSSQEATSPNDDSTTNKRSGDQLSSPIPKRSKNVDGTPKKNQQTIEESLNGNKADDAEKNENDDTEEKTNSEPNNKEEDLSKREEALKKREEALEKKESQNGTEKNNGHAEPQNDSKEDDEPAQGDEKNAFDEVKADADEVKHDAKKEQDEKAADINKDNKSIVKDEEREEAMPSTILEKGIIYFFFRGRVGIDEPQGLDDVARSYIVLRPLPIGAKIGSGPLEDTGNSRLLALPKKMLPKSTNDKFLTFVEKVPTSIKDLQEQFSGNDYSTQTVGTRHTPAATPFAEGIYAITDTGASSHLAYHITVPSEIGEVQKEMGLFEKGSYNISLKNPEASGPSYATIQNPAKYTKEIQEQFRGRRWMPVTPETLDFVGAQFLLIGEGMGDTEKAAEMSSKDEKHDKEKPEDELEKLEEEDHERVAHLKEDDPVFADLGLSSKEYPHLQTTW